MRICTVVYDMQEFGGMEEYAVTLAISLQEQGHQVSLLSAAWVPPDNQYLTRLRRSQVSFVQVPKWISLPASDWQTKEEVLAGVMWLCHPLVYLLGGGHFLVKRHSWEQSLTSAGNWLRGQIMDRFIAPDRRKALMRILLSWWRFRWHLDLLHIQGYTSSLLFVIDWAHSKGIPVVYEEHQTPDSQFDWWKNFHKTINKAAVVVAVSEKSAQALRNVCGVERPIVVRSPLLADPIGLGWRRSGRVRQGNESLYVTTIARLGITKGLTYLLDAIVAVKATHPTTRFRVYGDGPLRQDLLDYAGRLGLDGEQIFVGAFNHQELNCIMSETDIFVMSSILEGQPLAVVESMAYGCPIVTTSVGGIPELIQDGVNGFLCGSGDPACLADKIRVLIDDPALRQTLGREARKSYEQGPYQPVSVSSHFISLYQQVVAGKGVEGGP